MHPSRHLTSHAELAWNDLGLGRLGVGKLNLFGGLDFSALGVSTGPSSASGDQVDEFMSLDGGSDQALNGSGGGGTGLPARTPFRFEPTTAATATGYSSATPTENQKRGGNEGLMGGTGGGHFGPATRDKLGRVIRDLLDQVPLPLAGEETIQIVEYGALNSRSASLVAPIISLLASRHEATQLKQGVLPSSDNSLNFQVTHADKVSCDFRALSQQLESHSDSYLNQHWQVSHKPSLEHSVFSNFVSRPFGAKVLPKASVLVGFSAMSLHWLSTERKYRSAPATIAHGEMMAFLSARAHEFKSGGLLTLAFICRSEASSTSSLSPSSSRTPVHPTMLSRHSENQPRSNPATPSEYIDESQPAGIAPAGRPLLRERSTSSPAVPTVAATRDIWAVLTSVLGKSIQRLVSTQLLKPAVARQLLAMPIHARSPRQTNSALRAMAHAWCIEREEVVVLTHPAWKGLEHNTVSPASYTDHTIQLLKIFWESEMRAILRESLMSRAACEWILECLFDIAKEKLDEEGPLPLELEVQIIALRRKEE